MHIKEVNLLFRQLFFITALENHNRQLQQLLGNNGQGKNILIDALVGIESEWDNLTTVISINCDR